MKMLGKWDYSVPPPMYGIKESYKRAAAWLDEICPVVEDWGCGAAAAKPFFKKSRYIGVDGSAGYADVIDDLRHRLSSVPGILLRHVLEHNYDWPLILENAIRSFQCRMSIVFFLALGEYTSLSSVNLDGVPNLHVSRIGLERSLGEAKIRYSVVELPRNDGTEHKAEWLWLCEK